MFVRLEAMSALRRGAREGAGEEGSRQRGKRQWRVGKAARANEQENQESRQPNVAGLNAAFAARTGKRLARARRRGATRA
jgi:hypothetical protein